MAQIHNNLTDRFLMYKHIKNTYFKDQNIDTCVEVGLYHGGNTVVLDLIFHPNQTIGVDPYCLYPEYTDRPDFYGEFDSQEKLDQLYTKINAAFLYHGMKLIREFSTVAAEQFLDNSIDFVYLDADHKYEAVKKDIAAWWPKVKAGGVLSGHDYCDSGWEEYGVVNAVTEFAEANNLTVHVNNEPWASWWVYK